MDFKENTKPIYLQIVDRLCDEIIQGIYQAESRLPSVREYAALVQVNANTVMRSYDYLASREIIYNKRGIGFFVSPCAVNAINDMRQETFFRDEILYFFSRLSSMQISPEQLAQHYSDYLNNLTK